MNKPWWTYGCNSMQEYGKTASSSTMRSMLRLLVKLELCKISADITELRVHKRFWDEAYTYFYFEQKE